MKVYISADMEGVTGVTHPEDVIPRRSRYEGFRKPLTDDVNAATEGAAEGGATEFVVNEAHDGMRKLLFPSGRLPSGLLFPEGRLPVRGWRAVVWMVAGAFALCVPMVLLQPVSSDEPFLADNPLAITGPARHVLEAAWPIAAMLFFVSFVFAGASLLSRRVLARGEER